MGMLKPKIKYQKIQNFEQNNKIPILGIFQLCRRQLLSVTGTEFWEFFKYLGVWQTLEFLNTY